MNGGYEHFFMPSSMKGGRYIMTIYEIIMLIVAVLTLSATVIGIIINLIVELIKKK